MGLLKNPTVDSDAQKKNVAALRAKVAAARSEK
jgi:hypothetical protein